MNTRDIVIKSTTYLRGPNLWTYRAIIEAVVDIGDLEDSPSNTVPGLYERLTDWLPSLVEHRCSPGVRGGFLMRLKEGTWPCHILEHVTLALQDLAGVPGYGYGRARETETRGVYKVMVSGWEEKVTLAALYMGRDLVMAAIDDLPYDLEGELEKLRDLAQDLCLGPSTASMVFAAEERSIPALRLSQGNLVQFGYGAKQRRIWTAETDQTSAIAETISRDKGLTKELLETCGVPIPNGRAVENAADAWEAAQDLGLPVVVKPVDGNHGRGVFINLETRAEIEAAYSVAVDEGSGVLVERFIRGNEHRLLIVGGKLAAAAKGQTASVTGDGKQTVLELIASQINSDPRRGRGEDQPLNPVRIDSAARLELTRQGFDSESIIPAGREVLIQRNGNVAFDCTDEVHPEVVTMAALAAKAVGLDIAGIDLVAEDISKPLQTQGGAIVEVNAGPGLLMHLKPAEGQSRPVGEAIINHMFPGDENGCIPLVGVTGSHGTSRVARLTNHILNTHGWRTGLAYTGGLFVGSRQLFTGNAANLAQARRLLMNREVEAAVIENDGMVILTSGLAYDLCLIGIVTDIVYSEAFRQPEVAFHAFETAEDLIIIYRTQIYVVSPYGVVVLNADDAYLANLAQYCAGSVTFYSVLPDSPVIAAHRAQGKRAVFLEQNTIVLADGASQHSFATLSDLNLSEKPEDASSTGEVLASIAAAWGLGVSQEVIKDAIRSFA